MVSGYVEMGTVGFASAMIRSGTPPSVTKQQVVLVQAIEAFQAFQAADDVVPARPTGQRPG